MHLKLVLVLLSLLVFHPAGTADPSPGPIIQRPIQHKRFNATINSTTTHVWFLKLNKTDEEDIFRIRCSIQRPKTKRTFGLHYLQVTAMNGRDVVSFSLPEMTRAGFVVNETTRLLNPIKGDDIRNAENSSQYLTIQISTRVPVNFTYEILLTRLDQGQYIVKMKDGKAVAANMKVGFQHPIGFQLRDNTADILRISVKSVDELCGIFVISDSERSIYGSTGEISTSNSSLRTISFTKRMDVLLVREQIPKNLYMYYIGQPDDTICDENAQIRKNIAENKNFTIYYSTQKEASYFLPVLVFSLCFFVPPILCLLYAWNSVRQRPRDSVEVHTDAHSDSTRFRNDSFREDSASDTTTNPIYELTMSDEPRIEDDWKFYDVQFVLFLIPALLQNGFTYYGMLSTSNMDESCFHNYACAKPLGSFVSFNHMISNTGYLINAALYLLFVRIRRGRYRVTKGVKDNYFLEICLGLALLCEAMASSFYHVCPSRNSYHFDTPFIQVICVLLMLKLYGNRRSTISPTSAYRHIAIILTLDVIVTIFDSHKFLRFILMGLQFVAIGYVFNMLSAYHDGVSSFIDWLKSKPSIFAVVVALVNLGISGFTLFFNDYLETNQFITFLCVINMILFLTYYTITKWHYTEQFNKLSLVMLVTSVVLWSAALCFFLQDETSWALSPAQSRALNKDCILFDFFDHHDIWHLLSAHAILATMIAVSTLDDYQASVPFDNLAKF